MRPACLRCVRADRSCEYIRTPAPTIEFVQPREEHGPALQHTASSGTWKGVIEQQGALTDQPLLGKGTLQEMAVWTLADAMGEEGTVDESQQTQVRIIESTLKLVYRYTDSIKGYNSPMHRWN